MLLVMLIPIITIDIINAHNYSVVFSKMGVDNFIQLFTNSIKVLTALLAVITLRIALQRLLSSNEQVSQVIDNNLFNNFYKHRDMFNNAISKSTIINRFSSIVNIPAEYSLITSYNYLYYKNYRDFKPQVNDGVIQLINDYQNIIKHLCKDFEESNPSSIDYDAIQKFLNKNPSVISEQIKYLIKEQKRVIREYWKNENDNGNSFYHPDAAIMNFEIFSIFYWTLCFLNDVLLFDSKAPLIKDDIDNIYQFVLLINGVQ